VTFGHIARSNSPTGIYPAGYQGALHAPLEPQYKVPPASWEGILDQNQIIFNNCPNSHDLVTGVAIAAIPSVETEMTIKYCTIIN
jgi:hypothetical protein